jgi:hypothetical protein
MSTRGPGRGSRRWRPAALALLAVASVASLTACGSSNFANDPRPAAPIQVTATLSTDRVAVSPRNFGAGVVDFAVANLSDARLRFQITGPKAASTPVIKPNEPGSLQISLPKGDYRATAGRGSTARAATFTVGAKRASSRNKLLLP